MYKYFWDKPILRYSLYRSMLIVIFPCLKGLLMKAEIKGNTGVTYSIRDNHLDILVLLTSLIPAMPVSSSKPSATFNTFLRPHPATPAFFVVTVSLPLLCSLCHSSTNTVEGASRDYNERGTEGIKVRENGGEEAVSEEKDPGKKCSVISSALHSVMQSSSTLSATSVCSLNNYHCTGSQYHQKWNIIGFTEAALIAGFSNALLCITQVSLFTTATC